MNHHIDPETGTPFNAHQAWMKVMADVREIHKGEQNKHQGFSFRGIDTVMNAVGPIFRKYGVSCLPSRIVEAKHRDYTSKNGTLQHEAIITVEYRVTGPDGSHFLGESIGESSDSSDKATSQAMSVAYRTFLLQGLTMPTDSPDPDENTVDRAVLWVEGGWESEEKQTAEWKDLTGRAKALPDSPEKDEVRAWLKSNGLKQETITRDQANEFSRRLKGIEDAAPAAEGDPVAQAGWSSAAERTRTRDSLLERLSKLPAFESELIEAEIGKLGITDDIETFTKDRSTKLLALIAEAEALAKGDES